MEVHTSKDSGKTWSAVRQQQQPPPSVQTQSQLMPGAALRCAALR
jgi:hypothetical protein